MEFFNAGSSLENVIAIFILVLIICGNFLGQLFPCKVQDMFNNNIILKHVLGFFTLLFFAISTIPELHFVETGLGKFSDFILTSVILYFWFILMSKNYYIFWLITFGLAGIMYLIFLYEKTEKVVYENENKVYETPNLLVKCKKILGLKILSSTIFGFLIYMGAKKEEYGKKFDYFTFIFGKPSCRGQSPPFKGYMYYLQNAFT
jgi:hypothetical protein